jgi:hypothetical protein
MTNRVKLPKARLNRVLKRAQLADFQTKQLHDDVLLTIATSDLPYHRTALRVAGFRFDLVEVAWDGQIRWGIAGVCRDEDITTERVTLRVWMSDPEFDTEAFLVAAAEATVKAVI